jgi:serine protease Do
LKEGDVITKIDDAVVSSAEDVTKAIRKHKPDEKITITYERDGKTNNTTATLGKRKSTSFNFEMPNMEAMPAPGMPDMGGMPDMNFNWDGGNSNRLFLKSSRPRLGIKAQDTEDGKGVKVLDVDEESAAEKAGIKEDDVITEFDGKKVNSADELAAAARAAKDKNPVKISFNRNGKSQTVEVKTPKKLKTADL